MSKVLFRDVSILDSTGADPYRGDVLVEDDRIVENGVVEVFESARIALRADQLRALIEPRQIPWRSALRLLRGSPLVEMSWDGFYRLVGTSA